MTFKQQYTEYMLGSPSQISCVKLGMALQLDNKQINRYLEETRKPYELFSEIKPYICLLGGQLCIDDTTLLKEFSRESKADLVGKHWSGRYKQVVMGISLITLFHVDTAGARFPINWRVYDPKEKKSKNDYFLEMVNEVISWGIRPSMVSGDNWYASGENLRFITKMGMGFSFSLKENRLVRRENELKYQHVSTLSLSKEGEVVNLKDVGVVRIFEHQGFYHAYRAPNQAKEIARETAKKIERVSFDLAHRNHWTVEEYHRVLKQVCNIEHHLFRKKNCVISHIFFALRAFCVLEVNTLLGNLKNWYDYLATAIADYTKDILGSMSLNGLILS